jgi:hypothetical protein
MKSRKNGNGESAATSADLAARLAEHETALAAAREALKALEMERSRGLAAGACGFGWGFCESLKLPSSTFGRCLSAVLGFGASALRFSPVFSMASRCRFGLGFGFGAGPTSFVWSLGLAGRSLMIASP